MGISPTLPHSSTLVKVTGRFGMAHKLEDLQTGMAFIYEGQTWMKLTDGPATCRATPINGEGKGVIHALPANEMVEMGIGLDDLEHAIEETYQKLLTEGTEDSTVNEKHTSLMRLLSIGAVIERVVSMAQRISENTAHMGTESRKE